MQKKPCASTISLDSQIDKNIRLYTGARVNVVFTTYLRNTYITTYVMFAELQYNI